MHFAGFLPPLYVAALYLAQRLAMLRSNLRQIIVIDALLLNWLSCEIARITLTDFKLPTAYLIADTVAAVWLSLRVQGVTAGIAKVFYLAMILFNAAFFFASAFSEWTHWIGLSLLSWGQLICIVIGGSRDDLAKVAHNSTARFGLFRGVAFRDRELDQ